MVHLLVQWRNTDPLWEFWDIAAKMNKTVQLHDMLCQSCEAQMKSVLDHSEIKIDLLFSSKNKQTKKNNYLDVYMCLHVGPAHPPRLSYLFLCSKAQSIKAHVFLRKV